MQCWPFVALCWGRAFAQAGKAGQCGNKLPCPEPGSFRPECRASLTEEPFRGSSFFNKGLDELCLSHVLEQNENNQFKGMEKFHQAHEIELTGESIPDRKANPDTREDEPVSRDVAAGDQREIFAGSAKYGDVDIGVVAVAGCREDDSGSPTTCVSGGAGNGNNGGITEKSGGVESFNRLSDRHKTPAASSKNVGINSKSQKERRAKKGTACDPPRGNAGDITKNTYIQLGERHSKRRARSKKVGINSKRRKER